MQDGPGLCLAVDSVAAFLIAQENKGHYFPINKSHHWANIVQNTWCAGHNTGTDTSASGCVLLTNLSFGGRILVSLKSNLLKEKMTCQNSHSCGIFH